MTRKKKKAVAVPETETPAATPHPMTDLRNEIDRVFDRFLRDPWGSAFPALTEWPPFGRMGSPLSPSAQMTESDTGYLLSIELPGLDEKDIELTVTDDMLTLKGEKSEEKTSGEGESHFSERRYGSFRRSFALPAGEKPGLEAHAAEQIDGLAFSNGAHVAEIEVDPQTGHIEVLNYVIAHDCGVMVNPLVIDGQVAGGAAHGFGFAMYEKMIWDDQAQPQSTNLAEYLIPGSVEVPNVRIEHIVVPSSQNPLGVKGVGESGLVPVPSVIASALENALSEHGVRISNIPIGPTDILAALSSR